MYLKFVKKQPESEAFFTRSYKQRVLSVLQTKSPVPLKTKISLVKMYITPILTYDPNNQPSDDHRPAALREKLSYSGIGKHVYCCAQHKITGESHVPSKYLITIHTSYIHLQNLGRQPAESLATKIKICSSQWAIVNL